MHDYGMNETIIIDTPDGIAHYRFCAIIAALKIEIKTGMTMSGQSVLRVAKRAYPVTGRTKKKVLEELLVIYKNTYGWEYGEKN